MGCKAVVVKGGHAVGHAVDVLFDGKETSRFDTPRIDTKNTHGTGCTFSSAITAQLARGIPLKEAVEQAKRYVTTAIKHSLSIGKGNGPTHRFYELYRRGMVPENEPPAHRGQPMKPDYTLCLVTDRKCMSAAMLTEAVEKAVSGGCTMVQLREKELCSSDFYQLALNIREVTKRSNVPLIINDRLDIALAADADGVHIGQSDLPIRAARRLLGKEKLLGVSVASVAEAIQAQEDGADYLGVGAIFSTKTKKDAKTVAWDELRRIRESVEIPIIVIGGINKNNAARFRQLNIDGLAVISAVIAQPDIAKAARELKRLFLTFQ